MGGESKACLGLCVTITPLHVVGCAKFSPPGDLSTQRIEAQEHCQVRSVGEGRTSLLDWAGIGIVRGQLGGLTKPFILPRLHDVLHSDKKLTLVFEFCDQVKEGLGRGY